MPGVGVGVDAVAGKDDLPLRVPRHAGFCVELVAGDPGHALLAAGHDEFPVFFKPGDLVGEVDRRQPVVLRNLLHDRGGTRQPAGLVILQVPFGYGVDEADVAVGKRLPYLADDAFDRLADPVILRARIVDRELDEDEVRLVAEHVVREPEGAEIRAGPADRGVDAADRGFRIQLLQQFGGLDSPAVLFRDASAEVGDGDRLAGVELRRRRRQPFADRERNRFAQCGRIRPGGADRSENRKQGEDAEKNFFHIRTPV